MPEAAAKISRRTPWIKITATNSIMVALDWQK